MMDCIRILTLLCGACHITTSLGKDSHEKRLCSSTDGCSLEKNTLLTVLPQLKKEFSISFEFQAREYMSGWQSVIHLTEEGNCCEVGQRIPALWVSNAGQLHPCFAVDGNGNYNTLTDKKYSLSEWHQVQFSQSLKNGTYIYRVIIDGETVLGPVENKQPESFSNVSVYAADPWHNSLKGSIRNLSIINGWEDFFTALLLNRDASKLLTNIGEDSFNAGFKKCPVIRGLRAVYVRISPVPDSFNAFNVFTGTWTSLNNIINQDFKLYSNIADAKNNVSAWNYCNYDDPTVGFPRDCGINGKQVLQFFTMPGSKYSNAIGAEEFDNNGLEIYIGSDCPSAFSVTCPTGWTSLATGCYKFVNEGNYQQATINCQNEGGFLIEIDNQEELDSAFQFYKDEGISESTVWFGASDLSKEGEWTWNHSGKKLNFKAWYSGEPNGGTKESCLHAYGSHNFQWNDISCSNSYRGLCEHDVIQTTSAPTTTTSTPKGFAACKKEDNYDYLGNDIENRKTTGQEECANWCGAIKECNAWTLRKNDNWCWIKTSDAGRRKNNLLISGTKGCATVTTLATTTTLAPTPDSLPKSGNWSLLFRQTINGKDRFYKKNEWTRNKETVDAPNYSILGDFEKFRKPDGSFHLFLWYPELGTGNEWTQTSNPVTKTTGGVDNYKAILTPYTGYYWGGLEHNNGIALLDGSVDNSYWWYAIGSTTDFRGGIPGPGIPGPGGIPNPKDDKGSHVVKKVELYIDQGTPSSPTQTPICPTIPTPTCPSTPKSTCPPTVTCPEIPEPTKCPTLTTTLATTCPPIRTCPTIPEPTKCPTLTTKPIPTCPAIPACPTTVSSVHDACSDKGCKNAFKGLGICVDTSMADWSNVSKIIDFTAETKDGKCGKGCNCKCFKHTGCFSSECDAHNGICLIKELEDDNDNRAFFIPSEYTKAFPCDESLDCHCYLRKEPITQKPRRICKQTRKCTKKKGKCYGTGEKAPEGAKYIKGMCGKKSGCKCYKK